MGEIAKNHVFPVEMTSREFRRIPVLARADGVFVYDTDGKEYLDAISGIAVTNIGYGRHDVSRVMAEQAEKFHYCISNLFTNQPVLELARRLSEMTPDGLDYFQFTSGGSEANETAFKIARQFHLENGEPSRSLIISRRQSYHGATLGALAVTGMEKRREKYNPILLDLPHIAPAYCYRCPFGKTYPGCDIECARDLEVAIRTAGPERVMAFVVEPVVGSACGATVPPSEYFPLVREICSRNGVLLIVDEVITGMGRTGRNFGIDHWGVVPDMMTLAKGLSGGYSPLGAGAVHQRILDVFEKSDGAFEHIYTFAGNPVSASCGLAALDILIREDLISRSARMGEYLFRCAESLNDHAVVGDIRGLGLLMGIELVKDRGSKEPFAPEMRLSKKLAGIALQKGLIIYPCSGCVDGLRGDHFLICPPLIVSRKECDTIILLLSDAISELEAGL